LIQSARLPLGRAGTLLLLFVALCAALSLVAAEKPRLRVEDYFIDVDLTPRTHHLKARARVKFTALDNLSTATFELHNALRPTRVIDANGKSLAVERVSQDNTVRVALPAGLDKGETTTLTFDYEGVLESAADSPVEGLKLAYVGDDTSYLLYAGRWFPVSGFGTNRFTATIQITVPAFMTVIGSGGSSAGGQVSDKAESAAPVLQRRSGADRKAQSRRGTKTAQAEDSKPAASRPVAGMKTVTFRWMKPSFPGTIIAGTFLETRLNPGGVDLRVYFKPADKNYAQAYGEAAGREFQYFSTLYGTAPSPLLNVVELPDDTLPSAWAPEIAAIASRAIQEKTNYRLLANAIAHQWWGVQVSPASLDDWWLSDGFARYSEARYVESVAGEAAYQEATKDISVGALAYENVPLSSVSRLDPFSPEFQSLVTDKGAIILHMLRWVVGEAAFDRAMRDFAQQFAGKDATVDDFRQVVEKHYGNQLTWFFTQWLDSTGAPEFKNKYTVLRAKSGFRVTGEIAQDLDLFRMPVELRIDTDGKTEMKRIEVVGTKSPYSVETFGKPRRIVVDPDHRVLKNSAELKVRTAILRGQQLVQQGDLAEALREYQKALEVNKLSSLAHYRIAEVFFVQRNYQSAANAYREAIHGDGEPRWTEVWSHIQLGKIFDLTGQRERATNEYRQALQTRDNTQGAQQEAEKYLREPFKREREKEGD